MDKSLNIKETIHNYYWIDDINCATTTLKTLAKYFSVDLSKQLINSAIGLHGAGKYGAQCGLVEGPLMFIGVYGSFLNRENSYIVEACYGFAKAFESRFQSLQCRDLRPMGFKEDDPAHMCESLTVDATIFAIDFIKKIFHE